MIKPQVLILSSGIGKRFWPLTTPKPLINFLGQPLLVHQLKKLIKAGFNDVIITTTSETDPIISKIKIPKLSLKTVIQNKPLGMADAVLTASKFIGHKALLIMNASDLVDQSLFHKIHQQITLGKNFIVGKKISTYFPGGYLISKRGRLTDIIEKPKKGKQPSNFINLVFHGFQKPQAFLQVLKTSKSSKDDVYEIALSKFLKKQKFTLIRYKDQWQALKYPWHILTATQFFLNYLKSGISNATQISPKAIIKGKVKIEPGVKIFANAVISGPVYIGKNTIVGNNALIRNSHIGSDCVVGYNTEIARSWIGNNSWFHSNYVGDSVIENNVSFGAGTILANLRLDEQEITEGFNKLGAIIGSNVRLGINTNIMPGVKIGKNSFIAAGPVNKDIPENSFVKSSINLKIVPNRKKLSSDRKQFKDKL